MSDKGAGAGLRVRGFEFHQIEINRTSNRHLILATNLNQANDIVVKLLSVGQSAGDGFVYAHEIARELSR